MPKPKPKGKKITGKQAAIAVGIAGLLIIGYVLYRRRQAAAAAAGQTTAVPGGDIGAGGTLPFPIQVGGGVVSPPPGTGGNGGGSGGGQSCITVWFHGNPGHAGQFCGDTSTAAWFQSGQQWFYFTPGGSDAYGYSAYSQGDPGLPPGAGNPPTAQAASFSQAAQTAMGSTSVDTSTVGQIAAMIGQPTGAFTTDSTPDRMASVKQLSSPPPPVSPPPLRSTSPPYTFPVVGTNTGGVTYGGNQGG